jgi:ABC-2 type transport system permease protein
MTTGNRPPAGWRSLARVLGAFWAANIAEEAQYRANFVVSVLGTIFFTGMALLTLAVFFRQTPTIGGWTFWEVVVLLGVFNALGGFVETLFRPSIGRLPEYVKSGSLDLVLVRPLDAQFYVSFRRLDIWRLADVIVGFGLAFFALLRLDALDPGRIALFLVLFAGALALVYALWIAFMSLAFRFVAIENAAVLFDSVYEAARYPASAYPRALRFLFLYLVPIVWTTTIPAAALTGALRPRFAGVFLVCCIAALIASRLVWRTALRGYTSAGG